MSGQSRITKTIV